MAGELVFLSASFPAAFFLIDAAFMFTCVVLFFPAADFSFSGAFSYVVVSYGEGSNMGNGIGSTWLESVPDLLVQQEHLV